MGKSCVYIPNKGKDIFLELKSRFGYKKAAFIYNRVTTEDFLQMYKDTLTLNGEGIPTFSSIVNNPSVIKYLGIDDISESYNKNQIHLDDNLDNVVTLINRAHELNISDEYENMVAIVDYDSDKKITIVTQPKTERTLEIANTQYNIQKLNETVAKILKPLGITFTDLSNIEVGAGRVGLTNFNHAKDIASDFAGIMQVANNMEGHFAKPEEFAHFIIGIYRNTPIVRRSINYLSKEENAREVLGAEYDNVSKFYDGGVESIAEEAAGHILRDALLKANTKELKVPIIKRMINYIINLFKGLNSSNYLNSINSIQNEYGKLAKNIIKGDTKLSKQDILKAHRNKVFNALTDKADIQIEVLKKASEREFKNAALQKNYEETKEGEKTQKSQMRQFAETVNKTIKDKIENGESMAAIGEYLDLALSNIKNFHHQLLDIEGLSLQDKFILLMNSLRTIQSYYPTIKELNNVTTDEFLNDESISSQHFVLEDSNNNLKEFEVNKPQETVDTSKMSQKEIVERIIKDSEDWVLSEDGTYYINKKTKVKGIRVTKTIESDSNGSVFDPDSPWIIPSTNVGTGMDELFRDVIEEKVKKTTTKKGEFFTKDGTYLNKVYPNASAESLNKFAEDVDKFKKAEEKKGIHLIGRDVVANGTVKTIDATGKTHEVNVTGTLDLLGYDDKGNWYIYDMKTHRGVITQEKKDKYRRQVTLYKQFLEERYGIKVKNLYIIPIKVEYPAPKGYRDSTNEYTVSSIKPKGYDGREGNQLFLNGKEFKGANPTLEDVLEINTIDLNIEYKKLYDDPTNGLGNAKLALLQSLSAVDRAYRQFGDTFSQKALPEFIEFLKPFVGENVRIQNAKGELETVSLEKVLMESSKDITFMQKWFNSMADNPDTLLQIFDKVVKEAKDEHRIKTIEKSQEILALGKEFESRGITEYSWMFEEDKANYVNHFVVNGVDLSYDKSAYEKAKKEYIKTLDSTYGKYPLTNTEAGKAKRNAIKEWINTHTLNIKVNERTITIPKPSLYPSRYNTFNSVQKEFYNRWIDLKGELDSLLGNGKTTLTSTIKIRKSGIERIKGGLSGNGITEFVEEVKSKFMRSFDDDTIYKEARGIRGFNSEEILELPLYYLHSNGNNSDLSTDVISTLVAYAEMVYNYESMNKVVNPLEIGRFIVEDEESGRKISSTKGNKQVYEVFHFFGKKHKNPIYERNSSSNFKDALDAFFESKIYGIYLKDAGETMGMDNNKLVNRLLKLGSVVQLGFNVFANIANVTTGIGMQNIEAAAGEFFNRRELASADKAFMQEMPKYMGDIGQRINFSKLALFDEMFDVKQNFKLKTKNKDFLNKTILGRLFGPALQFLGQEAGDFWLYNRTAIAMAKRRMLRDYTTGKETSLWDALITVPIDSSKPELGNKLILKPGVKNLDGSDFNIKDVSSVSGTFRYVNQHLFGIYNEEDAIAARRTIWGRFGMQYRDWIPTALRYRFGSKASNLEKQGDVEGYYRTAWRFINQLRKDLIRGSLNIGQAWNSLSEYELRNIKRAIAEPLQLLIMNLIWRMVSKGDDDEDRSLFEKAVSVWAARSKTELGALVPSLSMPNEALKILRSPFANTDIISDILNTGKVFNPINWTEEVESGDYKGHSEAYKAFMKSPITLWYRNIHKTLNPERLEAYYNQ